MPTPNPAAQRIFADCAATTQEFLATFAEDRTPAGVVRAVAGIHAYADVSIAGFQAEYRAQGGPASACQAGCAYCCHGPVHLTPLETLHIVLHLASPAVSVDERTHWGERIGQQAARIDGLTVQGQIGRTIACPFLLDDCCGIYAVRPLLCRGRNAFDAAPCRAGFADPTPPQSFTLLQEQMLVGQCLVLGILTELKRHGLPDSCGDLSLTLAHALRTPDTVGRWLAGDGPLAW